ncbi:uncharacterized protein C3orf38 homolog [Dendropsophus ebraccatus]|uniref:uncharacterized protein C3orf38 homolog n=1 Tax=Dendropsophus ebraccatus TaxID=150705 RepID=UPI0038312EBB
MEGYAEGEFHLDTSKVKIEMGACETRLCPAGREVVSYGNNNVIGNISADNIKKEFCYWFYVILPRQIQELPQPSSTFASNCFSDNVDLECTYTIDGLNRLKSTGLKMTIWVLYGIFKEENLSFSPNLDYGGLQSQMDRYGILTVEVSGTVHKGNSCIGRFEHTFELVRSPTKGTFEIKSAKLIMHK